MLYSEQWLREWVNPALNAQEIADTLTMAGLEVDAVTPLSANFSDVYVAKIVRCEPHPDADKLKVCQVDIGSHGQHQIVCGAPNAREGIYVAAAIVGAVLPGDFIIKATKIRDVASNGMMCSLKELHLGKESDGILELPANVESLIGSSYAQYLDLNDTMLDIDLTPNRGDCLSMLGAARELSALTQSPLTAVKDYQVEASIDDVVGIDVKSPEDCPRYLCRVIKGVDLTQPVPKLIAERLRRLGVKSINPVVDITNYVMFELGQPMHAFDLNKISGSIIVNRSNGEKLTFLDGKETSVRANDLVISDENGAVALAGVIGGLDSSVTDGTVDILLESAYFSPDIIMGRARAYGLHTDASHRYERGVDPDLPFKAIERLSHLIIETVGGKAGPINECVNESYLPKKTAVEVHLKNCLRIIGLEFTLEEVANYLKGLGADVELCNGYVLAKAPSHRFDLNAEHDFIEEVARLHGYDNIPVNMPLAKASKVRVNEQMVDEQKIKSHLVSNGYNEVISYSFVDDAAQKVFHHTEEAIYLQNPISDNMGAMRLSLITGLLSTVSKNIRHQQSNMRLFEIGNRYFWQDKAIAEERCIAGILTGKVSLDFWPNVTKVNNEIDFFHAKGDVENLLSHLGVNVEKQVEFRSAERTGFHPYQCADIIVDNVCVGFLGQLLTEVLIPLDIEQGVFFYQLSMPSLIKRSLPKFSQLSKYPKVTRDLAFLVDENFQVGELLALTKKYANNCLIHVHVHVHVFDVYQGSSVASGKKSVAISMTFQDVSKTLEEDELNNVINHIINGLSDEVNATIRV